MAAVQMSPENARELAAYFGNQCSRLMYGTCRTRRCLLRGGWAPGGEVDVATCEEYEAHNVFATLALGEA